MKLLKFKRMKELASKTYQDVQESIFSALCELDPKAEVIGDKWERGDNGGGGFSRVISSGEVFEKGGVNFSEVYGTLPAEMSLKLTGEAKEKEFYATGTSLVIHPYSPRVPTTHANYRYLEVEGLKWFGGGADLTPYKLEEEDATFFHQQFKTACDKHNEEFYPKFKKWCDEYFYLPHRKETRGVGGIFYDYLGKDDPENLDNYYNFSKDASAAFLEAYLPIVNKRKDEPWTEAEKDFQLHRRGRYVEFNLIYDRGTLFGLKTNGRTESILMSLPAEVRWSYNYQTENKAEEEKLLEVLRQPKEWV